MKRFYTRCVHFVLAVSLFVSWFTLSTLAADNDVVITLGQNGIVDVWLAPAPLSKYFSGYLDYSGMYYLRSDNSDYNSKKINADVFCTDVTAGSGAPLALKFTTGSGFSTGYSSSYFIDYYFDSFFRFMPITGFTRSDFIDAFNKTGICSLTFNLEMFSPDSGAYIKPDVSYAVSVFDAKFAFNSSLAGLSRYTLVLDKSSAAFDSVFTSLYSTDFSSESYWDSSSSKRVYNYFRMRYLVSVAKSGLDATVYFSPLKISTNPAGAGMIESDGASTEIIVNGFENLEDAINTAVASGTDQVSSVIVQETQKVTDKMDEVTQTIIDLGSDVDMSLDYSGLQTVQDQCSEITSQIFDKIDSGEVKTVVSRRLSDVVSDSYSRDGFQILGSWMQRIFDMGFGTIIFMTLTLGVSLFIIGRRL